MILVIGATGQLGSMITHQLLAKGRAVRILVRAGSNYQPLVEAGAQPVIGDLRNPASLEGACQGIKTVITTAQARITEDEANTWAINRHGYISLIDAARTAGVHHFIFTSGLGADPHSAIPFIAAKGQTETYLRASGLPYTILEPDWILDGWLMFFVGNPALSGQPVWVVGEGSDRHTPVAAQDVAAFAVAAVDHPGARNRVIPLGGPQALSIRDAVAIFERFLGKPVIVQSFTPDQPPPGWPPLLVQLMTGFNTDLVVDTTEVAQEFGVQLTSAEEFVQRALLRTPTPA
ncbi:MAG: SDR family oxidoreductase [Chloroflexota bacterium]